MEAVGNATDWAELTTPLATIMFLHPLDSRKGEKKADMAYADPRRLTGAYYSESQ